MKFNSNHATDLECLNSQKQEEKECKWCDPNEDVKYVRQGGKVQCKYCSSLIASLTVTAETVMLQDKPWATVDENDGKVNFGFTGICTYPKWGNQKPPCKAVISLGEWKNFSETIIGNHQALLVKSTIPCMISGEDLKIVHSGQTATLEQINPLDRRKVLIDAYWLDGEEERRDLYVNTPITLYVQITNMGIGERIPLTFTDKDNGKYGMVTYIGIVGEDSLIAINNFILKAK